MRYAAARNATSYNARAGAVLEALRTLRENLVVDCLRFNDASSISLKHNAIINYYYSIVHMYKYMLREEAR